MATFRALLTSSMEKNAMPMSKMRKLILACVAVTLAATACIKVDYSLGSGLVDKSLLYDTYTVEFPLTNIKMCSR